MLMEEHLRDNRQMLFVAGPRQVGKTTLAKKFCAEEAYLNWDRQNDKLLFMQGARSVGEFCKLNGVPYEKDTSSPCISDSGDLKINNWVIDCKASTSPGFEGQVSRNIDFCTT